MSRIRGQTRCQYWSTSGHRTACLSLRQTERHIAEWQWFESGPEPWSQLVLGGIRPNLKISFLAILKYSINDSLVFNCFIFIFRIILYLFKSFFFCSIFIFLCFVLCKVEIRDYHSLNYNFLEQNQQWHTSVVLQDTELTQETFASESVLKPTLVYITHVHLIFFQFYIWMWWNRKQSLTLYLPTVVELMYGNNTGTNQFTVEIQPGACFSLFRSKCWEGKFENIWILLSRWGVYIYSHYNYCPGFN